MKRYYDYEHDQIVHEEELRKEYDGLTDNIDNLTFDQWLINCQTSEGGTLQLISGYDSGWLDVYTCEVKSVEDMYAIYRKQNEYNDFMDWLIDCVTAECPSYRRVI